MKPIKNKRKTRRRTKRNRQRGGTTPSIVFELTSGAGFFSTFFQLCHAYLYAKKMGYPFFVKDSGWQYTFKRGWHDYFTSLEEYNEKTVKNPVFYQIEQLKSLPDFTVGEYRGAINEIYKLDTNIQSYIDTKVKEYGVYKSLYVRQGDKKYEVELLTIDAILPQTNIRNEPGKLFVQTDDYTIVEQLKIKLPLVTILTETLPTHRGSDNKKLKDASPEERKADFEQFLKSIGIFLGGSECFSYYMSNIGTFHKFYAPDKVKMYVDPKAVIDDMNKIYDANLQTKPYFHAAHAWKK